MLTLYCPGGAGAAQEVRFPCSTLLASDLLPFIESLQAAMHVDTVAHVLNACAVTTYCYGKWQVFTCTQAHTMGGADIDVEGGMKFVPAEQARMPQQHAACGKVATASLCLGWQGLPSSATTHDDRNILRPTECVTCWKSTHKGLHISPRRQARNSQDKHTRPSATTGQRPSWST